MKHSLIAAAFLLGTGLAAPALQAQETGDDKVLRVCADPNNLPLSNDKGEGFENKIAELLAKDMGYALEYTYFPHRMGFIRMTLKAKHEKLPGRYKCDLIIGVPVGFDMGATIKPYFRSTYAMVFKKGIGLDEVKVPDDLLKLPPEKLRSLKFGVFSQTPPVDWLLRNKLFDQAISYQRQSGDPGAYPGEIVEKDLVAGKVDVAMAWGPIAGYFGRNAKAGDLVTIGFPPENTVKFDYAITMAVRYGEKDWKNKIEETVQRNLPGIQAILTSYGVPLIAESQASQTAADR
ncbi:quinoprotein dehydrogenase-associated putative ABC transporter substrate-binding protein [Methyloversatilis sp.]|uniref:quinoprotein dehydrogenase-associated putative ABC transporter substrate-binding protein n=1 Tax=Methyloversatilis sp. TaxID=2569862 RepID=UPI0027348389|nr:quinoprotein dehydrogenase-associated putative ABC transporter substrate-binding protein [Methyloversatilis sp.]MDP2870545.1 quinoprotein dehydrogenase-associated putative ABC transporter substrate-binding protein [Methyloversatilis sp.]MDP3457598.1 quinoprotein dehydrogenase-associated putative ABC transporter substrate-binding protein [Methyloversatilis sp.]MDP3578396.1 quinoprotein dehydrogenase-associated putative ABC transporter substrate-binding protein [Methyloversatilis sp.]